MQDVLPWLSLQLQTEQEVKYCVKLRNMRSVNGNQLLYCVCTRTCQRSGLFDKRLCLYFFHKITISSDGLFGAPKPCSADYFMVTNPHTLRGPKRLVMQTSLTLNCKTRDLR